MAATPSFIFFMCLFCGIFTMPAVSDYENLSFGKEYEVDQVTYPEIHEIHVETRVETEFKRTHIKAELRNHVDKSNEVEFSIILPEDNSYVDDLRLKVDGFTYKSSLKERQRTSQIYQKLASEGKTAVYIENDERDPKKYQVRVNMEPKSECKVEVSTGEVLSKTNNKFNVLTRLEAKQPVRRLNYHVSIVESRSIKSVKLLGPGNEQSKNYQGLPNSHIQRIGDKIVAVDFTPDQYQKRQLLGTTLRKENNKPVDFTVEYEVENNASYEGLQDWFSVSNNYGEHELKWTPMYGVDSRARRNLNLMRILKNMSKSRQNLSLKDRDDFLEMLGEQHLVTSMTSLIAEKDSFSGNTFRPQNTIVFPENIPVERQVHQLPKNYFLTFPRTG